MSDLENGSYCYYPDYSEIFEINSNKLFIHTCHKFSIEKDENELNIQNMEVSETRSFYFYPVDIEALTVELKIAIISFYILLSSI